MMLLLAWSLFAAFPFPASAVIDCPESFDRLLHRAGLLAPEHAHKGMLFAAVTRGVTWLKDAEGKPVLSLLSPLEPNDGGQIRQWFQTQPGQDRTTYEDPKWRDWWISRSQIPELTVNAYKISLPNQRIGGLIALQDVVDFEDKMPTTMITGIRVSPTFNAQLTKQPEAVGVGAALVTFAAVASVARGTEGIGLNSSLGAEGFYRKLQLSERKAFDHQRRYFFAKSNATRADFLHRMFEAYFHGVAPQR